MKGIHNFIAEKLDNDDPHDIITKLVESNVMLNDNENHLLTKFFTELKLNAYDKLGRALVEKKIP